MIGINRYDFKSHWSLSNHFLKNKISRTTFGGGGGGGVGTTFPKMVRNDHWPFWTQSGPNAPPWLGPLLCTHTHTYRLMVIALSVWSRPFGTTRLKIVSSSATHDAISYLYEWYFSKVSISTQNLSRSCNHNTACMNSTKRDDFLFTNRHNFCVEDL